MPDAAEILAQPTIAQAIRELVIRAMSDAGIGQAHCIRAAIGLTDRIATGEPVAEAVALVDDIFNKANASLKQQVIDSALRADRLEVDRTALIEGHVRRDVNGFWLVPAKLMVLSTADEALAAYRASLSPPQENIDQWLI